MKTPIRFLFTVLCLKSNLIKPSIVLAAAVLTAGFLPVPFARAATDSTYLMPAGTVFDSHPDADNSPTRQILTYGKDRDGKVVPRKTLTITNNSETVTVYPIMRNPNPGVSPAPSPPVFGGNKYDPYDDANREYRGYIGYKENGQYYFGLKPKKTIVVEIPLVFWNAARIAVGTDGKYLTAVVDPNPERYNPSARRVITMADPNGTIENGVIMWYRSDIPLGPADDTEDQLAEWTIRDHDYLKLTSLAHENYNIPDNQLLRLINYDVSNVDTLYLPLAMQATDTWVVPQATNTDPAVSPAPTDKKNPNRSGGYSPGSVENPFGWTGAIINIDDLQAKIRKFAENNTGNGLGQYFGGKGWPFYNFPKAITDPEVKIKIPSGANIFPQSPFSNGSGSRSSYNNEKYLLSSGGTELISETIGAEGDQTNLSNNQVRLSLGDSYNSNNKNNKIDFVKVGYVVRANPPCLDPPGQPCVHFGPNAIQADSTVTAIDPGSPPAPHGSGIPPVVTLSKDLVPGRTMVGSSVTFSRKKEDYAAEAMIKLWFSWAQYYLDHWKDPQTCPPSCPPKCPPLCAPTGETTINASNDKETATLRFETPHKELIKGMAVTGPHLTDPPAQTEVGPHLGDAVILDIASDGKSVVLSQVMSDSSHGPKPFTFSPPKELKWTPTANKPGYPLFGINFSNEPDCRAEPMRSSADCRHDPYDFSQKVYLIMASMNQIGLANNNDVFKFMQDIIGANMGFIFTQKAKESDEGKAVTSMIRDMIKSVLRGVSDFTKYPDLIGGNANGGHKSWYPDPAEASGGQSFNVFNLDPFVWFVHVKLGFSGYGFSVDDDTADIGSEGQSLQLSIAGKGGLKNNLTGEPEEWSIQAPFGPLKDIPVLYSGSVHDARTSAEAKRGEPPPPQHPKETLYNNISNVSHTTPITITNAGGQHPLANGDRVYIEEVKGENAANGWFKVGNVTTTTFSLFEDDSSMRPIAPTPGSTYIKGTGKWSYPLHPYLRITAGGPKTDPKKVFNRVKGDDALGTFQGTFVSVNGVDHNPLTTQNPSEKKFRVWQLGPSDEGILILDAHLTDASGNPLGLGDYKATFFGIPTPTPTPGP